MARVLRSNPFSNERSDEHRGNTERSGGVRLCSSCVQYSFTDHIFTYSEYSQNIMGANIIFSWFRYYVLRGTWRGFRAFILLRNHFFHLLKKIFWSYFKKKSER